MEYLRKVKLSLCIVLAAMLGIFKGDRIGQTLSNDMLAVYNIVLIICSFSICIITCIEIYKTKQVKRFAIWLILGLFVLIFSLIGISQ